MNEFRLFKQRLGVVAALLLFGLLPALAHADLQAGVRALEASNYDLALKELAPIAETGSPEAQFLMGRMYRFGWGVRKDDAEAVKWWRRAADQGDWRAQKMLAFMLREGFGTAKDPAEADKWERLAASTTNASRGQAGSPRPPQPVQLQWPSSAAVNGAYCAGMYWRAMDGVAGYHPIFLPNSHTVEEQRAAESAQASMMSWAMRVQLLAAHTTGDLDLDWLRSFTRREIESALHGKPPAGPERLQQAPEWDLLEAQMFQLGWIGVMGGNAFQVKAKACASPCLKEAFARQAMCVTSCFQGVLDAQEPLCANAATAPAVVTKRDLESYLRGLFAPLRRMQPK